MLQFNTARISDSIFTKRGIIVKIVMIAVFCVLFSTVVANASDKMGPEPVIPDSQCWVADIALSGLDNTTGFVYVRTLTEVGGDYTYYQIERTEFSTGIWTEIPAQDLRFENAPWDGYFYFESHNPAGVVRAKDDATGHFVYEYSTPLPC